MPCGIPVGHISGVETRTDSLGRVVFASCERGIAASVRVPTPREVIDERSGDRPG